jgi:hypothetical protein
MKFNTRNLPKPNEQKIPSGQSIELQESVTREEDRLTYVLNITIDTTSRTLNFPKHYGFSIQNFSAINAIQLSNNLTTTFQDYVSPSETLTFDNHKDRRMTLRTSAGNAIIRIILW